MVSKTLLLLTIRYCVENYRDFEEGIDLDGIDVDLEQIYPQLKISNSLSGKTEVCYIILKKRQDFLYSVSEAYEYPG